MKTKIAGIASLIMFAAGLGIAQDSHVWNDPHGWWNEHFSYDSSGERYRANELSLDVFGSYESGERKFSRLFQTNVRHGIWGGGVGANYFFTREIGIGADINIPDNRGDFVDQLDGSLIARVPIGHSGFAPYAFGGGGRGFDPVDEWLGHVGVGGEYRLNRVTGIFMDGRYVWADKSSDRTLFRAGLRFVF